MKGNKIRVAQWLLAAVLLPAITGCGASSKASWNEACQETQSDNAGQDAGQNQDVRQNQDADRQNQDADRQNQDAHQQTTVDQRGKIEPRMPVMVLYGPPPATYKEK